MSKVIEVVPVPENKEQCKFQEVKKIKKNKKCCIVGFAPSWNEAPYEDKEVDFWGINELYIYLQQYNIPAKFAAWFEIHDIMNSPSKQKPAHQAFLQNCKIPLLTQRHWDKYPSSMAYPKEYIVDYYNRQFLIDNKNTGFTDYSNQISWMIALAIALGYEEIMVYGVDMAQESEYAFQRASCQFFLGYAAGRGINLRVPSSCELLKAGKLYGFESDNTNRFRKKKRITSVRGTQEQLSIRNAQIKNSKLQVEKVLDKNLAVVEADSRELEIQKNDAIVSKLAAEENLKFLTSMPATLADINKAKAKVTAVCEENIAKLNVQIEDLEKKSKELNKKKEKFKSDSAVNILLLDKELEHNTKQYNILTGNINECNHDLNNNLV